MAAIASPAGDNTDWYVITDEADLTLRIANGLRLGEDRWGELTLNHPVAANRWLEFSIDDDGELVCRPCRRDVVIEIDGQPHGQIILQPGDPIALPHNLVHISNSFRRGQGNGDIAVVRCVEIDDSIGADGVPTLAQIVITESDLAPVPGPGQAPADPAQFDPGQVTTSGTAGAPPSMRPSGRSTRAYSIESALVPVDAHSPFAEGEISDFFRRPIAAADDPRAQAANSPQITPRVPQRAVIGSRNYTYLWALSGILGIAIIAALVAALTGAPGDGLGHAATGENGEVAPASAPVQGGTDELLRSVQSILERSAPDDPAAWEFAVRSYEFVLAAEPDHPVAKQRLANATDMLNSLRLQSDGTPAAPQRRPGTNPPSSSSSSQPAGAGQASGNAVQRPDSDASGATLGALLSAPTGNSGVALTTTQIARRLEHAREQLAAGQIVAPIGDSASALVLGVLAAEPGNRQAIELLNACADTMIDEAENAYEAGDSFRARNTLEEVLAFHPRHQRANVRWLEWTGSPSPFT